MRKDDLENLSTTDEIEGKPSRGRKRVMWMDSLSEWIAERGVNNGKAEMLRNTKERNLWRPLVAHIT